MKISFLFQNVFLDIYRLMFYCYHCICICERENSNYIVSLEIIS